MSEDLCTAAADGAAAASPAAADGAGAPAGPAADAEREAIFPAQILRGLLARNDCRIEHTPIERLKGYKGNARKHPKAQIKKLADCITQLGFNAPIAIDEHDEVIAGHGRLAAAKLLGLCRVPTLRLVHLSDAEKRAYRLADNRLVEGSVWDRQIVADELKVLVNLKVDIAPLGFTLKDRHVIPRKSHGGTAASAVATAETSAPPADVVCAAGDEWRLGAHRLCCGPAPDHALDELIRRWQALTGDAATLATTGQRFADLERQRRQTHHSKTTSPRTRGKECHD